MPNMVDELGFSIVHEHGFFNPPPAFLDQLVDAMGLTAAGGMGWRQRRRSAVSTCR